MQKAKHKLERKTDCACPYQAIRVILSTNQCIQVYNVGCPQKADIKSKTMAAQLRILTGFGLYSILF